MSLFAVGGFLGQAAGPIFSGFVTTRFGLPALMWSAPLGLVLVTMLALAMKQDSARLCPRTPAPIPSVSLDVVLRGKRRGVVLMIVVGVLRVMPGVGVPLAMAYLLKSRGSSNTEIGVSQAVFLGAVGLGSLACALFIRRRFERATLWVLPLLASPFLAACSSQGFVGLTLCVAVVGLLMGAVGPILVGYGQHLLQDAQRVASSLTMGVTWGLGGLVVAALMAVLNHARRPDLAFPIFAASSVLSSALCAWLPPTEPQVNVPVPVGATSKETVRC
jgi:FSR family fosmidomycin resistance protein-like MFS transporter